MGVLASLVANQALVRLVRRRAAADAAARWLELGSGIGNFTLPLAFESEHVVAVENDPRALAGLERSLAEADLTKKVSLIRANMHRKDLGLLHLFKNIDAVLADPPRSGLGNLLGVLEAVPDKERPPTFLYVSCFAESLAKDCARLHALGYRVVQAEGLDQFPQSKHCEWVLQLGLME